jgi:plastocyanin
MRRRAALALPAVLALALPAAAGSASIRTVELRDDVFAPKTIRADKGDRIRFVWKGSDPHNVRGMGVSLPVRRSGSRVATLRAGSGTIVCDIHPAMRLRVR